MGRPMRSLQQSHKPVFTETFLHSRLGMTTGSPFFAGTVLGVTMDSLPQLSQYANLYQRYKILRASWTLIPDATSYDLATTIGTGFAVYTNSRCVYAINDTAPALHTGPVLPGSEQDILQDNGCKIRSGNKVIKFSNRPVAQVQDQYNVSLNLRKQFISFAAGPNTTHWGVSIGFTTTGVYTTPPPVLPTWSVYCKLTFQVADPRQAYMSRIMSEQGRAEGLPPAFLPAFWKKRIALAHQKGQLKGFSGESP